MDLQSKIAFVNSCELLYEQFDPVYFWTFTFEKCHNYWQYAPKWNSFMRDLVGVNHGRGMKEGGHYPFLCGIRVVEVHPGENAEGVSHGLHFHALFSQKVDINILKAVGSQYGFGRMSVSRVGDKIGEQDTANYHERRMRHAKYMIKYMAKSEHKLLCNMRSWACFGDWKHEKVKDIQMFSHFHTTLKLITLGQKCTWSLSSLVYRFCMWYGNYPEWPDLAKLCVTPCNKEGSKVIDRPLVLCPSGKKMGLNGIVFWTTTEAVNWGHRHNFKNVDAYMCAHCGAIHARFMNKQLIKEEDTL